MMREVPHQQLIVCLLSALKLSLLRIKEYLEAIVARDRRFLMTKACYESSKADESMHLVQQGRVHGRTKEA